jgi:hypothetical protein
LQPQPVPTTGGGMSPKIQALFEQLIAAVHEEAEATFIARVIGKPAPARSAAKRKPGPKPGPKAPKPVALAKRAKGERRSPEEIERLVQAVTGFLRKNPSSNSETIAKGLAVDTKDLVLPIKQMAAGKMLKTTGTRRGTRYSLR